MRQFLALAAVFTLAAGAAQAQIQPPKNPYMPKAPTIGGAFKPYVPPKMPSVYADGPFSPRGEARRERRNEAAERARTNGVFSPIGEAKRERAQARRDAANNPF